MEAYNVRRHSSKSQEASLKSLRSSDVGVPDECHNGDDTCSLFDIDFTLPFYTDDPLKDITSPCTDEDSEEEEFEFDISSSNLIQPNTNQSVSPADNLISKCQLLPVQDPPCGDMGRKLEVESDDGKGTVQCGTVNGIKTQFPTLLKSATRLKVTLFGLKKSANVGMDLQASCAEDASNMDFPVHKQNKFLAVKFKVVDVPLFFRFTRDNSTGSKRDESSNGFQNKSDYSDGDIGHCKSNEKEKKKVKEIVQKYVKMIKPLYVKISQRYTDKNKHADLEKSGVASIARNSGFSGSERSHQNQLSFSGNLKTVYKSFCKERNTSSNVDLALHTNYNESTMLELQSAIQGAIAHCKQSNYTDGMYAALL